MKLPFAVYTATEGYGWSSAYRVYGRDILDRMRHAIGRIPDFDYGALSCCGVVNDGDMVAIYRLMQAEKWDSMGRNAAYLALSFVPRALAKDINMERLLALKPFMVPLREPPEWLEYEGPVTDDSRFDPETEYYVGEPLDLSCAGSVFNKPFEGVLHVRRDEGATTCVLTYQRPQPILPVTYSAPHNPLHESEENASSGTPMPVKRWLRVFERTVLVATAFALFVSGAYWRTMRYGKSGAIVVPVAKPAVMNLPPTVTAQIIEGKINVESDPVSVQADWRIEWPMTVCGAPTQALDYIRRQMIDDCFNPLLCDSNKPASRRHSTPNQALQLVFNRAYSKLEINPDNTDRFSMYSFQFTANLKIRFADAGYIGYVLEGCENEGGNGCHSYEIARVMSLATGLMVHEVDFMTAPGLVAFPQALFNQLSQNKNLRGFVIGDTNDAKSALGNFVIEANGIRWWAPAYSIFAGAAGVQNTLMTWKDLKPFLKPGKECEFKAIFSETAN